MFIQEARPNGDDRFPRETDLTGAHLLLPGMLRSLGPGTGCDVGRACLGCGGCPQSRPTVIWLLGDALGSPPPAKLQLLPGIIIAWIITRFRACWRILGWCQSREAGFRDCSRLLLLRAESERKEGSHSASTESYLAGPGLGKRKAERGGS